MYKSIKTLPLIIILFFVCSLSFSMETMTGNVDLDNAVTILDALKTAQYTVGIRPRPFIINFADVDGDGAITIVDALMIAQYSVKLLKIFPVDAARTPVPIPTPTPYIGAAAPPPGSIDISVPAPPPLSTNPDENLNYFYFSYDDSASTAAVELVKYKIETGQTIDPKLARPWEFLNYEKFTPVQTENTGLFDISMGLWERSSVDTNYLADYKLGVSLSSPEVDINNRNNIVITLIIDISGSMGTNTLRVDESHTTRMDIVKYGLNKLAYNLKPGDVINIITFATTASIVQQGLTYDNDLDLYLDTVMALEPTGSTNLNDGIEKGYQAALYTYDPGKTNRVVILTDAYANTGVIDPTLIAENIEINDQEGIYFSGLGISADFNEAYLNELVEAGRGAYFSLVTQKDAAKAFGERFYALLTIAAKNVQFRLDFPEGLHRDVTASEETSTDPEEVQPTNFSYNTSQYFFEGFNAESEYLNLDDVFKLTITYENPVTGEPMTEIYEKSVSEIIGIDEGCIRDAEIIFLFTELFGENQSISEIRTILENFYANYSSPLASEYINYINNYINNDHPQDN